MNLDDGLLLVYGFLLIGPVISIIAVIDSANRPAWAYQQAGFEKVLLGHAVGARDRVHLVRGAGRDLVPRVGAAQGGARPGRAALASPAPAPSPRVAPTSPPPEWLPDPTRRHELRFWDGARWSEHVSDRGVQSWDRV